MPVSIEADVPNFEILKVTPHKDYLYVKKVIAEYLKTFSRDPSAHISYDYALFYSLCYNFSISTERLVNLTLLNALLFEIDDEMEYLGKTNLKDLEQYVNEVIYLFQFPYNKTKETRNSKAIIGVWTNVLQKLQSNQVIGLTNTIIDYIKLNLFLFKTLKSKNEFIGLEHFLMYRRVDCCVLQMILLVEYALDYNVDLELPNSPLIKEFKVLVIDHIGIANDIIGAKVEFAKQEMMNYVLAILYESKCSFQRAIDIAFNYFSNTDKRMLYLCDYIKTNEQIVKQSPRVIEYVNAMMVMCFGHIQWTLETKRHRLTSKQIETSPQNIVWIKNNNVPPIEDIIGDNIRNYVLISEK